MHRWSRVNHFPEVNLYTTMAQPFPIDSLYFTDGPRHRRTNKRSLTNFNPDRLTLFATLCTMTSINLTTTVRAKFNELIVNARPPEPVEPEDYEQPVIAQSVAGGVPVEDAYGDAPAYIPGEASSSWTP